MRKTKPPYQWSIDAKRVEWLAVNIGVEGFAHEPIEVIELLCIFNRYEREDRGELIRFAATALHPFTQKGAESIRQFIARAEKGESE